MLKTKGTQQWHVWVLILVGWCRRMYDRVIVREGKWLEWIAVVVNATLLGGLDTHTHIHTSVDTFLSPKILKKKIYLHPSVSSGCHWVMPLMVRRRSFHLSQSCVIVFYGVVPPIGWRSLILYCSVSCGSWATFPSGLRQYYCSYTSMSLVVHHSTKFIFTFSSPLQYVQHNHVKYERNIF